jgi:hypothetical protein
MSTRASTAKSRTSASRGESASQVTVSAQSLIPQAAITAIIHPFTYGKTLIQLGYEPLKPFKRHTFASLFHLGTKKYAYPSIFAICGHIKSEDGWIALWTTGLAANVLQVALQSYVYNQSIAVCLILFNDQRLASEILKLRFSFLQTIYSISESPN